MVLSLSRADGGRTLSANFSANEFACRCNRCQKIRIDEALVAQLQQIRDHFGKPVVITSGYRCPSHNLAVGGTSSSYHTKGQASDFYIKGVPPMAIAQYAESIGVPGIGLYDDFVHIDTRMKKSYWFGHQQEYRSTFGEAGRFCVELRTLRRGSEGKDVKCLQALLTGLGYRIGIDGVFGPATENALKRYQKANALTADGIAGAQTQTHLLGI